MLRVGSRGQLRHRCRHQRELLLFRQTASDPPSVDLSGEWLAKRPGFDELARPPGGIGKL